MIATSAAARVAVLAGVAVLAAAAALAAVHRTHRASLPPPAGPWYSALAAPYTPAAKQAKSACGVVIRPKTAGVAHPVLPCGVKLYVRFDGREVLTQVIDRGQTPAGRQFDLTAALAKLLGVEGTQTIQWRFAG
jgi:rare lipoprotein A (peptidoglycan hydrolase)